MSKRKKRPPTKQSSSAQLQKNQRRGIELKEESQKFIGPLPPPSVLSQYDKIAPGAADKIIKLAESQAHHRQYIEKSVIDSDIRNSRLGLHYGLIIGLTSVIGGVICVLCGHGIPGSIIGGTGLTGLVSVFVYGARQRRKEREVRYKATIGPNGQS